MKNNLHFECHGIDPSAQAVATARLKDVDAQVGTAEALPFENHSFDIVIFGFCLYLCDREDLFGISKEADRVLRSPGWMVILDFYSSTPRAKVYHHRQGIQSYKMDYRTLFTWHPDYECMTQKVRHHSNADYTDVVDEWIAVSVLRKADRKSPL